MLPFMECDAWTCGRAYTCRHSWPDEAGRGSMYLRQGNTALYMHDGSRSRCLVWPPALQHCLIWLQDYNQHGPMTSSSLLPLPYCASFQLHLWNVHLGSVSLCPAVLPGCFDARIRMDLWGTEGWGCEGVCESRKEAGFGDCALSIAYTVQMRVVVGHPSFFVAFYFCLIPSH